MTNVTYTFKEDLNKWCAKSGITNLFSLKYDSASEITFVYYDNELVCNLVNACIHDIDTSLCAVIRGMAFGIRYKENKR